MIIESPPYPVLRLHKGRERSLIHRHPWVFSGAVHTAPKTEEGQVVEVQSQEGVVLGYGFWSGESQISCRIFEFDEEDVFYSTDYWHKKFSNALHIRYLLVRSEHTNAYRLIHAEGDFCPGIIVDVYADVAVVQILTKGTEYMQEYIFSALERLGYMKIYIKVKKSSKNIEGVAQQSGWWKGVHSTHVMIRENGVLFPIDLVKGQKTGFFIDQRDNRNLLKGLSHQKSVLNTFSYSGGFSVYASLGGATEVVSVDVSKEAMALCSETMEVNKVSAPHQLVVADCFDYLKSLQSKYDIVILDPPAFAKSAKAIPNASRGYKELNMLGMKAVVPKGGMLLTFSCSQNISRELFQKIVFSAAADVGREVRIIQHLQQPMDHPVNIFHPEGEYLKGLLLWVQ